MKKNIEKLKKIKKPVSDKTQIIKVCFYLLSELFKIFMATLLVLFVPQKCNGQLCTPKEMFENENSYIKFVLVYNFISFIVFIFFYIIEVRREIFLIKYLDIDNNKSDNYLPNVILDFPYIDKKLNSISILYYYITNTLVFFSITNFILSLICVFINYSDITTITSLLSFSVLISSKVYNSYYIGQKGKYKDVFESAYMTEYTSFNIIDKDYIKKSKNENLTNIVDNDIRLRI